MERLSREELIRLVERLITVDVESDEEASHLLDVLDRNVAHPAVSDLIFWSDDELTAEEIVDRALAYEPTPLPARWPAI